jgi:hypothetical protein
MKIEIIKGSSNSVSDFFSSPSDTPETDAAEMPIDRVDTAASRPCCIVNADFARKLERERDEVVEALMKIEEVFIDGEDTYEDWRTMGNIAREALEKTI